MRPEADPRTMMHFISAIMLTQLSSDPALVGSTAATTPFPVDQLMSIIRRVVEPLGASSSAASTNAPGRSAS
jgi:hypothetical protein